ncbi:unnamed protein product [Vitrella brassicaformis CCMP3155]|uniref:Uncharacterized protein n=2 Tax=Vitrella brassicaformis TaxID=1169539 RepID=A0A0G4H7E3_VITBC|nr:unnamed protein product [Vitrella brassicaformis CCMP3155]|eukprot:CEM39826.1 unnamed protein product [Vitrella brassicaformis CCMP3155]
MRPLRRILARLAPPSSQLISPASQPCRISLEPHSLHLTRQLSAQAIPIIPGSRQTPPSSETKRTDRAEADDDDSSPAVGQEEPAGSAADGGDGVGAVSFDYEDWRERMLDAIGTVREGMRSQALDVLEATLKEPYVIAEFIHKKPGAATSHEDASTAPAAAAAAAADGDNGDKTPQTSDSSPSPLPPVVVSLSERSKAWQRTTLAEARSRMGEMDLLRLRKSQILGVGHMSRSQGNSEFNNLQMGGWCAGMACSIHPIFFIGSFFFFKRAAKARKIVKVRHDQADTLPDVKKAMHEQRLLVLAEMDKLERQIQEFHDKTTGGVE